MDPVSIILGVAPLCLTALKGWKSLRRKITQFRENGSQISRFRKLLKTQMLIFREESLLLLQEAGLDPDTASDMVCDLSHENWELEGVETRIKNYLGEWYDDVMENSKGIGEQIMAFHESISSLDYAPHGKLSETAYKIKVSRHRTSLEEGIELLTSAVDNFRRVRKRRAKMIKSGLHGTSRRMEVDKKKTGLPPAFLLKAQCSTSFVESFTKTWTCLGSNGTHSTHTARLFLNSDVTDGYVNSRMVLEHGLHRSRQRSLLLLQVKSQPSMALGPRPPLELLPQPPRTRKARKLRAKDSPSRALAGSTSPHVCVSRQHQEIPTNDLCKTEDVCRHIFDNSKALHQSRQEGCVGYIVSTVDAVKHQLVAIQDRESTSLQTYSHPRKNLATTVQSRSDAEITFPEQLKLGLQLAQSVLQYHSVDLWRTNWSLEDIWYFDVETDLSKSLTTLHIDKPLASTEENLALGRVLEGIQEVQSTISRDGNPTPFGIRNTTLYCLGVALLQIGHWITIDVSDTVQVGKAEAKPSQFGRRYDKLTRRCLHFDFDGFEPDLKNEGLQAAIYHKIIRELEEMVNVLEGVNDG